MDLQKLNNAVIGTNLRVIRHRDPLRLKVDRGHIPDLVEIGVDTKEFKQNEARYFIEDHILPYFEDPQHQDAKAYFEAVQSEFLTPLQASMMLAGCYGYIYKDGHHDVPSVHSTFDILKMTDSTGASIWNMHTTPFLLHALEVKNSIASPHDRSTCSCMKDFANPTILKLDNKENLLDRDLKGKLQDTCVMQNSIDYALDGLGEVLAGKTSDDLKKSVLVTSLPSNTADANLKRQRKDPLVFMLEGARTTAGAGNVDGNLLTFVNTYCSIVTDCSTEWKAIATGTPRTRALFYGDLITMATTVSPHNKLRPPKLCANKDVCADNLAQSERTELSYASYNAYIWKYREAFMMCARAGVPQYTTLKLGGMQTELVYMAGQSFLFLAGVFAFTWSYMIARYIAAMKERLLQETKVAQNYKDDFEAKKHEIEHDARWYRIYLFVGIVCVVLAWIWLLVALGRGTHFYSSLALNDDDTKNQLPHDTDQTSGFFTVFFWAVAGVFFVLLCYLYWKFFEHAREASSKMYNAITGKKAPATLLVQGPVANTMAPYATVIRSAHPKQEYSLRDYTKVVDPAATQIQAFNTEIIAHLEGMAPFAQVALDLTVISGLAVLAMASVAQRGVQDINVLSAVSVWFLAIGVIAHLSNMLRLLHVYVQFHHRSVYNDFVKSAAHHRVYLSVLLGVMLLAYVWFAGADSGTTTSTHTSAHQFWFAVLALVILCGSDLLEQIAGAFKASEVDKDDDATTERFWMHLCNKNYYVAWLVIVSLILLHLHRAQGVCEGAGGKFTQTNCLFLLK